MQSGRWFNSRKLRMCFFFFLLKIKMIKSELYLQVDMKRTKNVPESRHCFSCLSKLTACLLPFWIKKWLKCRFWCVTLKEFVFCFVASRSRLADFHMNCQMTPHTVTTCPHDNYHGCLMSYVGLIGNFAFLRMLVYLWISLSSAADTELDVCLT